MNPGPEPDATDKPPRAPESWPRIRRIQATAGAYVRPLLPWFSLAFGLGSAMVRDRGPGAGWKIALAAFAIWLLILLQRWLSGMPMPERRWLARVVVAARRSSLMAAQSLLQMKLFFALPFFVQAADLTEPAHLVFVCALMGLSAASLWDPLTERWLAHRRLGALLPATASFIALTAVLPGLGLSTRVSLWLAAFAGGVGAGSVLLAHAPHGGRMRVLPQAFLVAAALPLVLWLGLSRIVPAAPLRLVTLAFGNQRQDHWVAQALKGGGLAPSHLFCATAIASPLGVQDRLFHVWHKNGELRSRIPLDVKGGREAGFRTLSWIEVGPHEAGRFRCSVETANGQLLGSKSIKLQARESVEPPGP
jgi:hypothetical protein